MDQLDGSNFFSLYTIWTVTGGSCCVCHFVWPTCQLNATVKRKKKCKRTKRAREKGNFKSPARGVKTLRQPILLQSPDQPNPNYPSPVSFHTIHQPPPPLHLPSSHRFMSPLAAPALNHPAPGPSHLSRTGSLPIYPTP